MNKTGDINFINLYIYLTKSFCDLRLDLYINQQTITATLKKIIFKKYYIFQFELNFNFLLN